MSVLLGGEFGGGGGEDFGVGVDIGFGGSGGHEGHVVKRREEAAAVEGVKVEETLEFEIGSSGGFAAIARRRCSEGGVGRGTGAGQARGPAEWGGVSSGKRSEP